LVSLVKGRVHSIYSPVSKPPEGQSVEAWLKVTKFEELLEKMLAENSPQLNIKL